MLLRGESGIGKSRLVEALREQVRNEGYRWLTFRCSPYHTHSAFYPVIDCLEHLLQWSRDMSPEAKFAQLEQALQRYRIPSRKRPPSLPHCCRCRSLQRAIPPQPESAAAEAAHAGNAGGVPAGGDTPAASAPVWEDLHWADPSTLELLSLVINQAPWRR